MRKITFILALLYQTAFAQSTFKGMIEYEVTVRIDESIRASNPEANIPEAYNYTEKLLVNDNMGKVERVISFGNFGGGRGNAQQAEQMNRQIRRMIPETFLDLKENKIYTVVSVAKDTVNVDKYVTELVLKPSDNLQETKKTKKILGYNCKKATLKTEDDEYTIWYTTELGFTYSPLASAGSARGFGRRGGSGQAGPKIPTIIVDKGVILAIEGLNIGFEAKKIDKEIPIDVANLKVPAEAKKVSKEELDEILKKQRGTSTFRMGGR